MTMIEITDNETHLYECKGCGYPDKDYNPLWHTVCDCGNQVVVCAYALDTGLVEGCPECDTDQKDLSPSPDLREGLRVRHLRLQTPFEKWVRDKVISFGSPRRGLCKQYKSENECNENRPEYGF